MRAMLVTGGAGFIGSNFVRKVLSEEKDLQVINLDALTYAGNYHNVEDLGNRHIFVKGDICDTKLIDGLFQEYDITRVVNFAAESHVDRSISNPSVFVDTNVGGTQKLLSVCKKNWLTDPSDPRCTTYRDDVRYLQISTDEVYGALGPTGKFTETTPLSPNSPYSASKASADLFVRAYINTYHFPAVITRCSNNYGPYQFPEKLIPLAIKNLLSGKKVPIYGNGLQIRDWIYVEDHCDAVMTVLEKGALGNVYNVGCENERTNLDIIKCILSELDKPESCMEHVDDRLGHDVRYAIDNHKIRTELGWTPKVDFEKGIKLTIDWYLKNENWIENILSGEYKTCYVQN